MAEKQKEAQLKNPYFFFIFKNYPFFSQPGNLRKEQKIADFKIEKSKKKNGWSDNFYARIQSKRKNGFV